MNASFSYLRKKVVYATDTGYIITGSLQRTRPITPYKFPITNHVNPYHAEGYSRLVPNYAKRDYSRDRSKCSTMPSATIVA